MKTVNIKDIVAEVHKDDILDAVSLLGLEQIDENLPMTTLRSKFVKSVLNNAESIFDHLPIYDRYNLRAAQMSGCYLTPEVAGYLPTTLTDTLLATTDPSGGLLIAADFVKAIEPQLIKPDEPEMDPVGIHERITLAILNIYGIIRDRELVDLLHQMMPQETFLGTSDFIGLMFDQSIALRCREVITTENGLSESYLLSPFMSFYGEYLPLATGRRLKEFSHDQIADAAYNNPVFPDIPNPATKQFERALLKLGAKKDNLPFIRHIVWMSVQEDEHITETLKHITEFTYLPEDKVLSLMQPLVDYCNNMPRWRFGGFSSKEMFEQRQKAEPETGGVMKSAAIPHLTQPFIPDWPSATVSSVVGPDDPCPCGSGKKFKNCHGAN